MADENKWEKYKKTDTHRLIDLDELLVVALGFLFFLSPDLAPYKITFIIAVIAWYWLKVRYYEGKIVRKEKEYYNIYFENINPNMSQPLLERRTEKDREPIRYDLKILEHKRKFLVDKFIIVNLIILILVQFI